MAQTTKKMEGLQGKLAAHCHLKEIPVAPKERALYFRVLIDGMREVTELGPRNLDGWDMESDDEGAAA